MLGRLMALPLRLKARPEDVSADPPESGASLAPVPPEALAFPPMQTLRPPAPDNDDVLRPVQAAVEEALRASGYLD